jgi:hypothetical protein
VLNLRLSDHLLNHWRYVTRLLLALSEYHLQCTLVAVKKSPCFGLIIDLSSDRTSRENMLVYIIYFDLDSMTSHIAFLCCVRLLSKDGQAVFDALVSICQVCGLDMVKKLRTFCADGDGAMQGHRKGVVGRMRGHCDCLISMHCAAHRHVLTLSSIADQFPLLVMIDAFLSAVHSLLLRRPKEAALWELWAKKNGLTAHGFPLFVATRWFSRKACIDRVIGVYVPFVRFLTVRVNRGTKDEWVHAKHVLEQATDARVVIMLHALADLLEIMQRACNVYQTAGCKLSLLTSELNTLSEKLEMLEDSCVDLQTLGGANMDALRRATRNLAIEEGFIVFRHTTSSVKLGVGTLCSDDVVSEFKTIVRGVREQISERFPAEERGLAHLFSIFQLESVSRQSARTIDTFGAYEISELVDTLSKSKATGREFFCNVPFIDTASKSQVRFVLSFNKMYTVPCNFHAHLKHTSPSTEVHCCACLVVLTSLHQNSGATSV